MLVGETAKRSCSTVATALLFDVFGTLVDWRGGVIEALRTFAARTGISADWAAFADDWRAAYGPSMDRVRRGEVGWQNLDALHAASLAELLERYGAGDAGGEERARLVKAWHALRPWPDVVGGLERLRRRFIVASLSNGNIALQIDLRRHAELPLDMLFSAELFGHYKPDPQTYLGACALLDLRPERVMLVAAHTGDLLAAQACGLQTAFIARPLEHGVGGAVDTGSAAVDLHADGIDALAQRLGA